MISPTRFPFLSCLHVYWKDKIFENIKDLCLLESVISTNRYYLVTFEIILQYLSAEWNKKFSFFFLLLSLFSPQSFSRREKKRTTNWRISLSVIIKNYNWEEKPTRRFLWKLKIRLEESFSHNHQLFSMDHYLSASTNHSYISLRRLLEIKL